MVSIVIADDHGVLRGGLRSMLNAEPDLRVVGEAEDGNGALRLTQELGPDVLLADISMPGPSGIDVARDLCCAGARTHVVVLTMHEDPCLVLEARQVGAKGFVTKRSAESELIKAVRVVAAGGMYWPQQASSDSRRHSGEGDGNAAPQSLQPDETRLLLLVARACTNVQIAAELGLTLEGVDERRKQLMEKLGLRNRVDIFRYAHDHDITGQPLSAPHQGG